MRTILTMLVIAIATYVLPVIMASTDELAAISSKVAPEYVRVKRADGSLEPETYAFGRGGVWSGPNDPSLSKLEFTNIAHTIALPLASQSYIPSKDPKTTKLLLMVYWGATTVPPPISSSAAVLNYEIAETNLQIAISQGDPYMIRSMKSAADTAMQGVLAENSSRDILNLKNAGMIGYADAFHDVSKYTTGPLRYKRADLVDELEDSRYFVVIMAYDFQILWKQKKHRLLWETRFSVSTRCTAFDEELAAMANQASRYFGRETKGIVRGPLAEGHVEIGEAKVLPDDPEKK